MNSTMFAIPLSVDIAPPLFSVNNAVWRETSSPDVGPAPRGADDFASILEGEHHVRSWSVSTGSDYRDWVSMEWFRFDDGPGRVGER